jgi:hypothetical protein
MARICIFCGATGTTKEHAWPEWISSIVQRRGGIRQTSERWGERFAEWTDDRASLTVNRVCAACNNGWMSQLEGNVKPILSPLIRGQRRTLWTDHQRLIAAWAIKMAMVFEFTGPPKDPYFTQDERAALRAGTLPENSFVMLARYVGRKYLGRANDRQITALDRSESEFLAYVSTFAIGQLVLQSVSHRNPLARLDESALDAGDEGVIVHPTTAIRWWPPTAAFNDEGLEALGAIDKHLPRGR